MQLNISTTVQLATNEAGEVCGAMVAITARNLPETLAAELAKYAVAMELGYSTEDLEREIVDYDVDEDAEGPTVTIHFGNRS